jgi:hypothetical protein
MAIMDATSGNGNSDKNIRNKYLNISNVYILLTSSLQGFLFKMSKNKYRKSTFGKSSTFGEIKKQK